MKANDSRVIELETQLTERGVRGALAWLNGRTQYRYTALYLLDDTVLKNIYVFDRNDPIDKPYTGTPINESYCNLVMNTEQAIIVTDTLRDARTTQHPHNTAMRAFCGFPLRRADGSACGALCHFDDQPLEIDASERAMLDIAGKVLGGALEQIAKI